MKLIITLILLFLSNYECKGQTFWTSKFHEFEIELDSLWTVLPSIDTKEKMLFGVIDKTDGKSYIIKITKDVPTDQLSDEQYYQTIRELMLGANSENKLLEEKESEFHGEKYHEQIFIMNTPKWGVLKQNSYIRRTGQLLYSIQISFPINDKNENTPTPTLIIELDKEIKLTKR